ncbi:MAG: cation-translocating P-type ATPase, partial [Bacteroidales bacterium]|nr:cation-translocating P-type ATPase [Bacteroidales bacterium]
GTLTQNRMKVDTLSFDTDPTLLFEALATNTSAHLDTSNPNEVQVLGNPTEGALLLWMHDQGISYKPIRENTELLQRMVFSAERKFMASQIFSSALQTQAIYLKGAPEVVMSRCSNILNEQEVREQIAQFQARGMRTLAFAYRLVSPQEEDEHIEKLVDQRDMVFLGYAAIADPIRADVPRAIQTCMEAGIEVKIVTGDVSDTACEIARQAGLWRESSDQMLLTGAEFAALSDEEALAIAEKLSVLSRARPSDKLRLVRLLQQQGNVVAVTGDGTNDAPALNYANVGLSMGSGTSVAKEASDVILLDDSFVSIVHAVRWGRSIYQNIQRFLQFQLTINVVALVLMVLGPLIGVNLPLTITQMLWVNLIMDTFAALALASEPSNAEVLKSAPRKVSDFIINRQMGVNILSQSLFFLILLVGLMLFFHHNEGGMTPYKLSFFFTAFVLLQFWNLFNARCLGSVRSAFSGLAKNPWFLTIVGIIIGLQVVIVQFGGKVFRTVPLSFKDWIILILCSSCVLWIGEIRRFIARHRSSKEKQTIDYA